MSGVSRQHLKGGLSRTDAETLLVDLEAWYATTCRAPAVEEADVQVATAFVRRFELSLKLPDAIHHACANRLGLPVVTLDQRRYRAAESLGVAAMLPA